MSLLGHPDHWMVARAAGTAAMAAGPAVAGVYAVAEAVVVAQGPVAAVRVAVVESGGRWRWRHCCGLQRRQW